MSSPNASLAVLTDAELSRYRQDRSTQILQAMDKVGHDVNTGTTTPEQSDIDIGALLAELQLVESEVSAEQRRREQRKKMGHRVMLGVISILAAAFFYFVFSN